MKLLLTVLFIPMGKRTFPRSSLFTNIKQVNLQMTHLKMMKLESDIRRSLLRLPDTLEDAYKQIYDDILNQKGNASEVSKMSSRWIMGAAWPLTPTEWVCATRYAMPYAGPLTLPSLLDMCHNLVVEDQGSTVVRFAHLSVSEYLKSKPEFDRSKAHVMAANAYFSVLCDAAQAAIGAPSNGLLRYATGNWSYHLDYSDYRYMRDSTLAHIRKFLGTPENPGEAYCKWMENFNFLRDLNDQLPNSLFAFA